MILKPFSVNLNSVLDPDDVYLPLTPGDRAKLLAHLPQDDDETILTISDDLTKEYVRAQNNKGTIVLTRGVESEALKFPTGSCVYFENSLPVTEWLICNYECCKEDCKVTAPKAAGVLLPDGKAHDHWEGGVVFSGDLPMQIAVTNCPAWLEAKQENNYLRLSGTAVAGTFTISVAAANTAGLAVQQGSFEITV